MCRKLLAEGVRNAAVRDGEPRRRHKTTPGQRHIEPSSVLTTCDVQGHILLCLLITFLLLLFTFHHYAVRLMARGAAHVCVTCSENLALLSPTMHPKNGEKVYFAE